MHFSGLCWFFFFFFFCHTQQLVGSKFPNQGLNPYPGQWVWSPNHWTARKLISCWFICKAIICNSSKRQNILSSSLSSHLRKWLLMWGRDRKEQCHYHPPMKCSRAPRCNPRPFCVPPVHFCGESPKQLSTVFNLSNFFDEGKIWMWRKVTNG